MSATLKRVIHHRSFLALVTLAVLWGGFSFYQSLVAPTKLDPALRQAMEKEETIARIAVNFEFQPEEYHINTLQDYGIVAGVQGRTIYMIQVPTSVIRKLSGLYWVKSIQLATQ